LNTLQLSRKAKFYLGVFVKILPLFNLSFIAGRLNASPKKVGLEIWAQDCWEGRILSIKEELKI
jgi:hypothetical protein